MKIHSFHGHGEGMLPWTWKTASEKIMLHLLEVKLSKVMRVTTLLLTMFCLHASAFTEAQVTLSVKKMPIEKVFVLIKKQTGVLIMYNTKDLADANDVTLNINNVSLHEAFTKCLSGQDLKFSIEGNSVFISKREKITAQEKEFLFPDSSISVQGKLANEKNEPIFGATIQLKGTNRITQSNASGDFEFNRIKPNSTLIISDVNYETREYKVNGKSNITILLQIRTKELSQVNVTYNTGFQEVPKERATGSFVKVDKEIINRNVSTISIIDRLEGVTSSLLFDRRNDLSGNPMNRLQIRGLMTLSEGIAQPLIVLDNFPYAGNLNNINPNDIESITILRDAAAASIWGAKAANGVIVLTSKKGTYNQRLKVSVNATYSTSENVDLSKLPILNSSEMIDLEKFYFSKGAYNLIINNRNRLPLTPVQEVLLRLRNGQITQEQADIQLNQFRSLDVRKDFENYIYRRVSVQQYSADFSGGGKNFNYLFGVGYDKKLNNLVGDQFSRVNLRILNSIKPIDNLNIQFGVNYAITNTDRNSLGGFNTVAYKLSPNTNLPIYSRFIDENGNHLSTAYKYRMGYTDTAGNGQLLDWKFRPLDELDNSDKRDKENAFLATIGINYRFLNWLSADIKYQYQKNQINTRFNYNENTFYARDLINLFTNFNQTNSNLRYPIPIGGILDITNSTIESQGGRASLIFSPVIKDKHQINGIVGLNIDQEKISSVSNRIYGYNENLNISNVDYINTYPRRIGFDAMVPAFNNLTDQTNRLISVFSNIGYTYDNRYTITGSLRRDASNLFGVSTNDKWKPFWSIGGAWNILNEKFINISWLNQLSFRTTYGYAGNVNNTISAYYILYYLSASSNSFVNTPYNTIQSVGNPNLRWEKVGTLNLGLDWALKNNRLSGRVEYFTRNANDIISAVPLDPTMGFGSMNTNSAKMKGNGLDISINSQNVKTKEFQWQSEFNLSVAKSKVVKVLLPTSSNGGFKSDGGLIQSIEGYTPYLVVSYKWAGLDPSNGDPQGILNGKVSKNYDSIVSFSPFQDQVIHGSAVPELFGNLLNTFEFKGIRVSANITYNLKYFLKRPSINYGSLINGNSHTDYRNRWQNQGDELNTTVPSFVYPARTNRDIFYQNSEVNIIKGDHVRLEDIRVSYTFPKGVKWIFFEELSFLGYMGNINLLLWKANKAGIDPRFPNGNISGKNFSFGLRAKF